MHITVRFWNLLPCDHPVGCGIGMHVKKMYSMKAGITLKLFVLIVRDCY